MNHHNLRHISFCMAAAMLIAAATAEGAPKKKKRTIESVKTEQTQTKREIKETGKKLNDNKRETERGLVELNRLRNQSQELKFEISSRQTTLDSLNKQISIVEDSVNKLDKRIDALREAYIVSLRRTQGHHRTSDKIAFLFSAKTFKEAYRRFRYLGEFSDWQKSRTRELKSEMQLLDQRRKRLSEYQNQRMLEVSRLSADRQQLDAKESETATLVASLKAKGGELQKLLQQKEAKAQALDRELDKLIAAEQARIERERAEKLRREQEAAKKRKEAAERKKKEANKEMATTPPQDPTPSKKGNVQKPELRKPANEPEMSFAETERKLSGSFSANKGRLLFPVGGSYRVVRGFGKQQHPDMRFVQTDNSGIDIEAKPGTGARAIYAGRVASVMQYPGCNNIVIVRHGDFYSVYSNLGALNVKIGDDVNAGQRIGTIFSDPAEDNRAILHFELRRGSTKLNPMEWVR